LAARGFQFVEGYLIEESAACASADL